MIVEKLKTIADRNVAISQSTKTIAGRDVAIGKTTKTIADRDVAIGKTTNGISRWKALNKKLEKIHAEIRKSLAGCQVSAVGTRQRCQVSAAGTRQPGLESGQEEQDQGAQEAPGIYSARELYYIKSYQNGDMQARAQPLNVLRCGL